jgi:DNA-binding NarL/FixJ family response regulator
MAGAQAEPPFVGRTQELRRLLERLREAGDGDGGLVLLAGEPGIGKTRLLRQLAAVAGRQGWVVLNGRAGEQESGSPYLPFIEALRPYVRRTPVETLREQLGDGAPDVALILRDIRRRLPEVAVPAPSPWPASAIGASAASTWDRYHLWESVSDFLLAVARGDGECGLLLTLDDLQWADPDSLGLLLFLARRLQDVPLLIAGSYRAQDAGPDSRLADLLLSLRRDGLVERLALAPLSVEECAMLMAALAGTSPASSSVETIYRVTGGNPFFMEEAVLHLLGTGCDLADPAAVAAAWTLPEGVRHMIGRRLARLRSDTQRLLQAGAVLGEGFNFELLGELTDLEAMPLMTALEEALTAGVLREEPGGYYFGHALIRETLYDGLSLPRRRLLHLRAAEAIEQHWATGRAGLPGAVVLHYREAGPAAGGRALQHTIQAAETAASMSAWDEAAAQWTAALDLVDQAGLEQRGRLLIQLGEALLRTGARTEALQRFDEAAVVARQLMPVDPSAAKQLLAHAALGRTGSGIPATFAGHEAIQHLEEALAALGDDDSVLRVRLLSALVIVLCFGGHHARGVELSHEAVVQGRRLDDAAALWEALNARLYAVWGPDQVEERLAIAAELTRIAEATGNREALLSALLWRIWTLLEGGDAVGLEREWTRCLVLAAEVRHPLPRWYVAQFRALRAGLEGRAEDAERLANEALALGNQAGRPDAQHIFAVQLTPLYWQHGVATDLLPMMERFIEQVAQLTALRCAVTHFHAELGRLTDARREFERLAAPDFAQLPRDLSWLCSMTHLVEACAVLDDHRRADTLYTLLRPFDTRVAVGGSGTLCYGSVARSLGILAGLLGRWDDAAAHFEQALEQNRRLGAASWVARTQVDYARMVLSRDPSDRDVQAAGLLNEALATARGLNMPGLAERAERLRAASSGAPRMHVTSSPSALPPPGLRSFPAGLTAREVEVLRLLAVGRTNREIAAELVLSEGTVHQHVVRIYQKIAVGRRAEAASFAIRHDLI